ncbi:MAG: hypothetical protein QOF42_2112 [Gammaproteobacteria bacterium]|jgi:hypothetical protein|nr:hypothetical protein [Gammaproteobacteria bacterium]
MRVAVAAAFFVLSACATNGLSLAPPKDVNFSGHWELNVADSDDPQHLLQTANQQAASASDPNNSGGRGSGRGGGRGRGAGSPYPGATPPATPAIATLSEAFVWPGKMMDIKQVAGVVAFTSDGSNRICTPSTSDRKSHHRDDEHRPSGHDLPPLSCGWSDKTLIVQGDDSDRAPYESSFSVSEDGKRLVEMVAFKGGHSNGFTLSRVWDRSP